MAFDANMPRACKCQNQCPMWLADTSDIETSPSLKNTCSRSASRASSVGSHGSGMSHPPGSQRKSEPAISISVSSDILMKRVDDWVEEEQDYDSEEPEGYQSLPPIRIASRILSPRLVESVIRSSELLLSDTTTSSIEPTSSDQFNPANNVSLRGPSREAAAAALKIPRWYSTKHWDPREKPIKLLRSIFEANYFGDWVYNWTVFRYGAHSPTSSSAGKFRSCLRRFNRKSNQVRHCVENGHGRIKIQKMLLVLISFLNAATATGSSCRTLFGVARIIA
ncbi:hypothetical protein ABW20_dc0101693 [Dactylellina cionopaga]|nr:hypothetical protein ABW20_dc0101693 [Dactylellina cionopaga]